MSEESVLPSVTAGRPKGLLQQMEELMAALNADLQSSDRTTEESDAGRGEGQRPLRKRSGTSQHAVRSA